MEKRLPEKLFIEVIEATSGLSFKKGQFGFIEGLHSPCIKDGGYIMAGNYDGFRAWKSLDGQMMQQNFKADYKLSDLIEFFSRPFPNKSSLNFNFEVPDDKNYVVMPIEPCDEGNVTVIGEEEKFCFTGEIIPVSNDKTVEEALRSFPNIELNEQDSIR